MVSASFLLVVHLVVSSGQMEYCPYYYLGVDLGIVCSGSNRPVWLHIHLVGSDLLFSVHSPEDAGHVLHNRTHIFHTSHLLRPSLPPGVP